MTIIKNSRQIPKVKEITADPNYFDRLYTHLQIVSKLDQDTGTRTVAKKDIKFTELANIMQQTRQTVSKRFKGLIDKDLVRPLPNGDYELPRLDHTQAFLLPERTAQGLVSAFTDNAITVYVYLLNRYIGNDEQPYEFSLATLKERCGMPTTNSSNNYIITSILDVLRSLGLIQYTQITKKDANGKFANHFVLASATNELPQSSC